MAAPSPSTTCALLEANLQHGQQVLDTLLEALEQEKLAISNAVDVQALTAIATRKMKILSEIEMNLLAREQLLRAVQADDVARFVARDPTGHAQLQRAWERFSQQVQAAAAGSSANAARISVLAAQTDEALAFLQNLAQPQGQLTYTARGAARIANHVLAAGHA